MGFPPCFSPAPPVKNISQQHHYVKYAYSRAWCQNPSRNLPLIPSPGVHFRHERKTWYADGGVDPVGRPLPEGYRSGVALASADGLARVGRRSDPEGGGGGGLFGEVGQRGSAALRLRRRGWARRPQAPQPGGHRQGAL